MVAYSPISDIAVYIASSIPARDIDSSHFDQIASNLFMRFLKKYVCFSNTIILLRSEIQSDTVGGWGEVYLRAICLRATKSAHLIVLLIEKV